MKPPQAMRRRIGESLFDGVPRESTLRDELVLKLQDRLDQRRQCCVLDSSRCYHKPLPKQKPLPPIMSDAEANRIVLPEIPLSPRAGEPGFLRPEDVTIDDAAWRYLVAVVGPPDENGRFTCGCACWPTTRGIAQTCQRHRAAIEPDDDGQAVLLLAQEKVKATA